MAEIFGKLTDGVSNLFSRLGGGMTLSEFLNKIGDKPELIIVVVLTLGVILVNGWTDAPNAIATCVTTRSMRPKPAILMAAVMNFLGVFVMTLITPKVAATISNMVDFSGVSGGAANSDASIALCAALFSIVVWATAAWAFGIPTSESHALIAGLTGAAIALHNGLDGVNGGEWIKVIYGLGLSVFLGFFSGFIVTKIVEAVCRNMDRVKTVKFFKGAQVVSAGSMAFMHGAQDGQKFMGIFLLGIELMESTGTVGSEFQAPLWLMALCSIVMALGTSMGGEKIIKTVGMDMVKLETYQGFSADLSASLCLVLASVCGLPVSTTHTKTTAMMGVGASRRLSAINMGTVKEMVLAWVLTFPGCGLLSFLMVKLFMWIF